MSALLKQNGEGMDNRSANLWRHHFPILSQKMNGKPLVYLDSAASAQKPVQVIDAMGDVMRNGYANIHRGLYALSQNLTAEVEGVRARAADFIGASEAQEIIFTRNTTEAINLVAQSWGRNNLREGDEILITEMEHHANIVPWQLLREQIGIVLKILPITDDGALVVSRLPEFISPKTKLFSFTHISNVLGTVNDASAIVKKARALNAELKILIDGSQSVVHEGILIGDIDCDFFAFTGHKIYGPTGIGVLCVKKEVLDTMPPWQGGGDMIESVSFDRSVFKKGFSRFEAGTPAIVEIIGLGAAIDFLDSIGPEAIIAHEHKLLEQATAALQSIKGLKIFGTTNNKAPIITFTIDRCHASDIAMILDQQGIAVRSGHHCCMPLIQRFGVEATVRASFGLYNTLADVDALVAGVKKAQELLA